MHCEPYGSTFEHEQLQSCTPLTRLQERESDDPMRQEEHRVIYLVRCPEDIRVTKSYAYSGCRTPIPVLGQPEEKRTARWEFNQSPMHTPYIVINHLRSIPTHRPRYGSSQSPRFLSNLPGPQQTSEPFTPDCGLLMI